MGSRLEKNSAAVQKRIASHEFNDEDGEEYEASEFGGFGDYFRHKKMKLQNLDAELRAQAADKPQIFKGVVAHVTGYTQPPLHVLHRELVQHGAGFLQYLDGKTMATHIIASAMPPKKTTDFQRYRVVKPAWVMDSIAAGRLLPWTDYRVIDDGPRQKIIRFGAGKLSTEATLQSPTGYREQTQNSFYTSQFQKSGTYPTPQRSSSPFSVPSAQKPSRTAPETVDDSDDMDLDVHDKEDSVKPGEQAKSSASGEQLSAMVDPPEAPIHNSDPGSVPKPAGRPMTSEEHNALLLQDPKIRKSSTANPDFLKQYYSESRLHHLSTWKAELKSRLMKMAAARGSRANSTRRKSGARRYIMHVDFDSFFCAVSLRDHAPEHRDKPAVVAHSTGSGSEIASCNYPARRFGVKNGMWMKRAQELCPDLKVVPYDFPAYENASRHFYDAILDVGGVVQSVSIDEALVDITDIVLTAAGSQGIGVSEGSIWREQEKANEIASNLRAEIKKKTDCHVSVGIGGNILLAKVALRKAKPAGQHQIRPEEVLDILGDLKVEDLPGVAYSIGGRLEEMGIKFVKDLRQASKERLTSALGPKTGEKLWEYARGIDRAEVGEQPVRKSVSADVNWGIRFVNQEEAEEFVRDLCKELERRLLNEGVKGKQLTMKIMRRSADAPLDPAKHLGHGKCDTFTKSVSFGIATNDAELLGKESVTILRSYKITPGDLRGLGVQMTKLEPIKPSAAAEGSQRKLTFGGMAPKRLKTEPIEDSAGAATAPKRLKTDPIEDDLKADKMHCRSGAEVEQDPITVDPLTPRKPKVHPALALAMANAADEKAKTPLNIAGTQFVIPSNPDPAVLAELPQDIRRRLVHPFKQQQPPAAAKSSRSASPAAAAIQSRPQSPAVQTDDEVPSDVDPEVFHALPEDVKAEVRAAYGHKKQQQQQQQNRPTSADGLQTRLPQSPRTDRIIQRPRERSTPTKRGGIKSLFNRARERQQDAEAGRVQTSLPAALGHNEQQHDAGGDVTDMPDELDPTFLAELPEDVRRDVIEDHRRRMRLRQQRAEAQRSAAAAAAARRGPESGGSNSGLTQARLKFPPKPPRISFTKPGVTSLSEIKDMVGAWHGATRDEGPHTADVDVFARYVGRVVVEERDMEKARALVRWLEWVVEEEGGTEEGQSGGGGGAGKRAWKEAVERVKDAVQEGMKVRGLGRMEFG
ncbi:hypothetical protein VTJ49DRAFT_7234 [Mycothermus thermophilus]|uniref:DNA repair protein REV1 n=1 Tax=Humicola insolens TaxID=85995 RepID=A0ABR3VHG8_HUMIN